MSCGEATITRFELGSSQRKFVERKRAGGALQLLKRLYDSGLVARRWFEQA